MKRILLFVVLLFILFFIPNITYGITPIPTIDPILVGDIASSIPVLSCGVAGDTTGKDKCCHTSFKDKCSNPFIDFVISSAGLIPSLQNVLTDGILKCTKIQDYANTANNTPCVVGDPTVGGQPATDFSDPNCKCTDNTLISPSQAIIDMCGKYLSYARNPREATDCVRCATGNGLWTGMGCLPLDITTLITSFVLTTGIGIGGGFALLCIIYAAFMMQSSQGNPEKLKKAQEMITSCIMGLMLIIFSVFIMKLIGVNILRIPGFG